MNTKGGIFTIVGLLVVAVLFLFSFVAYQYFSDEDKWDEFNDQFSQTVDDVKNKTQNLTKNKQEFQINTSLNETITYEFVDYKGNNHSVSIVLYDDYATYYENKDINMRLSDDKFYPKFFEDDAGEEVFDMLVNISAQETSNDRDQLLYLMALVSDIDYRYVDVFYYPYDILENNFGACTDKAFLMVEFLERLGYGTALIDFPDNEHMTAGIKCNVPQYGEYCILETTKDFVFVGDNTMSYSFTGPLTDTYSVIEIHDGRTYDVTEDLEALAEIESNTQKIEELQSQMDDILDDVDYMSEPVSYCSGETDEKPDQQFWRVEAVFGVERCEGIINHYNKLVDRYNSLVDEVSYHHDKYDHLVNYS